MSSAVVSTSAALGRPFVFDVEADPEVLEGTCGDSRPRLSGRAKLDGNDRSAAKILPTSVTPASRLEIRPAPEMVSSGIPALDTLTGGLPRGCLTEICGPASSGRTTLLLAALAAATRRGEYCAVVDASDALDPHSAAAAGVEIDRLLWVRCGDSSPQRATEKTTSKDRSSDGCPISRASSAREVGVSSPSAFDFNRNGWKEDEWKESRWRENGQRQSWHRLEQVLRATDLLLESGGFGLIILDLGDMPTQAARRIPLTTWFRFRRAIEHTPTILLTIEQHPIAGSCSSLLLQLGVANENGPAATQRKIAAHSLPRASRGGVGREFVAGNEQAPEGRKTIHLPPQPELDFPCPPHTQLFTGLDITAELIRSRLDRKPVRPVMFTTKTAWAG